MSMYKVCKKCGRSLPAHKKYFNENRTSKDGFQSYCRSCQKRQEIANALKRLKKRGSTQKPQSLRHFGD